MNTVCLDEVEVRLGLQYTIQGYREQRKKRLKISTKLFQIRHYPWGENFSTIAPTSIAIMYSQLIIHIPCVQDRKRIYFLINNWAKIGISWLARFNVTPTATHMGYRLGIIAKDGLETYHPSFDPLQIW